MSPSPSKPRVMIWVQHLLGIGHVTRAAVLARAMNDAGLDVLVAQGGGRVPLADFGSAQILALPTITSADATFSTLIDAEGRTVTEATFARRRGLLLEASQAFDPDVVMTEHFPFGRRAFRPELLPWLEMAKGRGASVISSVRDVLVDKGQPRKEQAAVELVQRLFDQVLVHGDERLIPFDATFGRAADLASLITYTGYVADERPTCGNGTSPDGHDEIIVSVGGGAVGEALLQAAVGAATFASLAHRRWRLLHGAKSPPLLSKAPPANVIIEPARPDFKVLLGRAALSISQGGYNTVLDVLQARCPAVIVPFADGGESEQTFRALALQRHGLVHVLEHVQLSPDRLGEIAIAALAKGVAANWPVNLAGAQTSAGLILKLAKTRSHRPGDTDE